MSFHIITPHFFLSNQHSFKDCIPLEYDNKKLVFVILYYEVEVNDRAITPIIYVDSKDLSWFNFFKTCFARFYFVE